MNPETVKKVDEYKGLTFNVTLEHWPNGWLIKELAIHKPGIPELSDDDQLYPTDEDAFEGAKKLARKVIDELHAHGV